MTFTDTTSNGITTRNYKLADGRIFSAPINGTDYCVACGGDEVPSTWQGKVYIYMYDRKNRHHDYYCFQDDRSYDVAPWER